MNRLFLVMALFFMATSIFAKKRLHLEARARCPIPPIEVFIDEDSKELILEVGKSHSTVQIVITDLFGNNVCNNNMEVNGISVLLLPMIDKGEYVITLILENVELCGRFSIEGK